MPLQAARVLLWIPEPCPQNRARVFAVDPSTLRTKELHPKPTLPRKHGAGNTSIREKRSARPYQAQPRSRRWIRQKGKTKTETRRQRSRVFLTLSPPLPTDVPGTTGAFDPADQSQSDALLHVPLPEMASCDWGAHRENYGASYVTSELPSWPSERPLHCALSRQAHHAPAVQQG